MNSSVNTSKEMDKSLEAKPKRHFKQSGRHKCFYALCDSASLGKSNKDNFRRLSVARKGSLSNEEDDSEMGFDLSNRDDEQLGNQRLKLPKKYFVDSKGNYAMVPRKLRSAATKKRLREFISLPFPESKKLNHSSTGVKLSKKNGLKKSAELNMKLGGSTWSQKQNNSEPITKDEEDVAETLSALAEMFTNNEEADSSKLCARSSEADTPTLPGEKVSIVSKNDMNTIVHTVEAVSPSFTVESGEAMGFNPKDKSIVEQPDLQGGKQLSAALENSASNVNLRSMLLEPIMDKTLCSGLNFASDLSLDIQWKLPKQQEALAPDRKPELTPRVYKEATRVGCQPEHHPIKECNKNAFWPSLSTEALHGAGCYLPSPLPSISKIDAPSDAASYGSKSRPFESCFPTEKISKVASYRRSRKRCATHMYISHFIQVQQTTEIGDGLPEQPNQLKQNEDSRQEILRANNTSNNMRNISLSNGTVTTSNTKSSAETKFKADNPILQNKKLYQDQANGAMASGVSTNQKQNFNFLSLSTGGGELETNGGGGRSRNESKQFTQLQGPGIDHLVRLQTLVPFPINRTCYSSSADSDKLQLPAYMATSFVALRPGSSMATQQLSQKQQQMLWAPHLQAQLKPVSSAMTQVRNWQNRICPSLEASDSKYSTISQPQQQQQIMARNSLPANFSRQSHNLTPAYEETGVGLHAGGTFPLQLLCNDRR